jgi:hypothetical protein
MRTGSVKAAHLRNYETSLKDTFASAMVASVNQRMVETLRVHAAGDFYDSDYVRKWIEVARECRQTTFFAYTRSWRDEEQLPWLISLGNEPNVQLWWSMDRDTGHPPVAFGIRTAYMAIGDEDARQAPDDVDLIFRNNPRTVLKRANSVLVCPEEQGVERSEKITCSRCGICWKAATPKVEKILC